MVRIQAPGLTKGGWWWWWPDDRPVTMKPTRDGLGVEIKLAHGENDLDVESGRRPSSGEASAVKDYMHMCCGRESR